MRLVGPMDFYGRFFIRVVAVWEIMSTFAPKLERSYDKD